MVRNLAPNRPKRPKFGRILPWKLLPSCGAQWAERSEVQGDAHIRPSWGQGNIVFLSKGLFKWIFHHQNQIFLFKDCATDEDKEKMGSYALFHENMLANLASLIWGTTEEEKPETKLQEKEPACEASPKDSCGTPTFRAATPSEVDEAEWVLVDRPEVGGCGSHGECEGGASNGYLAPAYIPTSSPVPFASEGGEGVAQEWLMTPPPCFTRSQAAPLASSPLENLLIEHPSMSVYLPRPTNTSAAVARIFPRRLLSPSHSTRSRSPPSASLSPMRTPSVREDSPMREDIQPQPQEQQVAIQAAPATRSRAVQRAAKLLEVIDVLRPAQKAQRRKEERRLKAKHLERSNKAREVAAAGNKRAKRCNMMTPAKFSRAVNNRKC